MGRKRSSAKKAAEDRARRVLMHVKWGDTEQAVIDHCYAAERRAFLAGVKWARKQERLKRPLFN
jgi:hypothetical protein